MPATVIVNGMTVVHSKSDGVTMIFPDVCKTPSPGGPVPIPYPNIAMSSDTANGSKTVSLDGVPTMLKPSFFAKSSGDEPGTALGVVSNKVMGKAYPKMYSFDVKVEGENVQRLLDIMLQNVGSPTNTPPGTLIQPPDAALPPDAKPDKAKVKKITWDTTECVCGDLVTVSVETENIADGEMVPVTLERLQGNPKVLGNLNATVMANKDTSLWTAQRGSYTNEVKVKATASGLGGPAESSNQLLIKKVPEETKLVGPFQRTTPKFVADATGNFVNSGSNYGWEVCYEIKIAGGELVITRKVAFDADWGVKNKNGTDDWKREIENIWDRKYKIHRDDCMRGNTCNCTGGCCVFPIRIKCEFGGGHGKKVKLNKGANDPNDWGGPKWWYSHNWWEARAGVPATVRAHEFGHLIGMYDEYPQGACDPGRLWTNIPTSIMSSGATVYPRHFIDFKDWFDTKAVPVIGASTILPI